MKTEYIILCENRGDYITSLEFKPDGKFNFLGGPAHEAIRYTLEQATEVVENLGRGFAAEPAFELTEFTDNSMADTDQFDYILEISAWADTGTTEYIGITGQPTRDELHNFLAAEVDRIHAWMDEETEKKNMDARTDEPQVAVVRQRPEADEDGDFPPSHEWPIIIDWN